MTEVRSYSIPQDKNDLITRFDKLDGSHASNVVRAIEIYMDSIDNINPFFPPRFNEPIESWVKFIHEMNGSNIKKFGRRLDQIHRIFEDVK